MDRRPGVALQRPGQLTVWAAAIVVTLLVAVVQAAAGLWLGRVLAPGHG